MAVLLNCDLSQGAVFLERIEFGQWPEHAFLGPSQWFASSSSRFWLVNASSTMHFSDFSSVGLEAGIAIGLPGHFLGSAATDSMASYTFERVPNDDPINMPVDDNWFYYTQKFPGPGIAYFVELNYDGPLQVTAVLGSKIATWAGWAEVASYNSIFNGLASSAPGLAPVGSLVPFTMTYELVDGTVWTEDRFSRDFLYQSTGTADFANWIVPEPACVVFLGMGGMAFLGYRTRIL